MTKDEEIWTPLPGEYCGPIKDMEYKVTPATEDGSRWHEVLNRGRYKGYEYCIVSYGSYPCAYIAVPEGHPTNGMIWDDFYKKYSLGEHEAHGGFSFSCKSGWFVGEPWTFGWDYAHYGDYCCFGTITGDPWPRDPMEDMYSTEDVLEDVKNVIDGFVELFGEGTSC